ncbi:MAG: hypothetical protein WA395_03775 [Nitrososphaeraceae archaeon]
MIRRLQPGYNGGVGALHSHSDDKPRVRYCQRCNDLFGVQACLGPRIRMMGPDGKIEPPQPGDDQYLTCRNCGSTYSKHETRIEAEIGPIKEPMTGTKGKVQAVEKKPKQRIGRGSNPRLKGNKWEIKDSELKEELKSGSVLLAYSSNDPTEPVV